MRNLERWLK